MSLPNSLDCIKAAIIFYFLLYENGDKVWVLPSSQVGDSVTPSI